MTSAGVLAMFSLAGATLLLKGSISTTLVSCEVAFHLFGCAIHQLVKVGQRCQRAALMSASLSVYMQRSAQITREQLDTCSKITRTQSYATHHLTLYFCSNTCCSQETSLRFNVTKMAEEQYLESQRK